MQYRNAQSSDYTMAGALLEANQLPNADLDPNTVTLLLAEEDETLVGCIGLEAAGQFGLLRSMAVSANSRGKGIARNLYERLLLEARRRRLTDLYCLTATADAFFTRLGFLQVQRELTPEPIRQTRQFRTLCPESAHVYGLPLKQVAWYFPNDLLTLRGSGAGARHFAVSLAQTTLSYFEVDAKARFEKHVHEGEQITFVIEGELFFEFDDRTVRVNAGEMVAVPAGVPHAVWAGGEPVRAVDAWSPARLDL